MQAGAAFPQVKLSWNLIVNLRQLCCLPALLPFPSPLSLHYFNDGLI